MSAPDRVTREREARWPETCPLCSHDFGRDAVVFDLATHVAVRHADEMKAWLAALSTQEEAGVDEQAPDIDETRDFDAAWIANACALYVKHARRTEAGRCPCKGCSDIRERLAPQVAGPDDLPDCAACGQKVPTGYLTVPVCDEDCGADLFAPDNESTPPVAGSRETEDWPRLRAVFERIWPTLESYLDGDIGDLEVTAALERLLRAPAPGAGTEEVGDA